MKIRGPEKEDKTILSLEEVSNAVRVLFGVGLLESFHPHEVLVHAEKVLSFAQTADVLSFMSSFKNDKVVKVNQAIWKQYLDDCAQAEKEAVAVFEDIVGK